MVKSYLKGLGTNMGLTVPSVGDKTQQFIRVLCVVTNVCLFFFFWGGGGCVPSQKRLLSLDKTMRFTVSIKVQSQSLGIALDCSL